LHDAPSISVPPSRGLRWLADLLVAAAIGGLLFAILNVAAEWHAPFRATTQIDLSFWRLPQYVLYSLARGWAAMALSLVFAIVYATWAYYDRRASAVLLPVLDILQSIPVLGFMPGLVLALVAIFPTSNVGLELACVFMIFTAQVWNMVFSYYDSLRAIPPELRQMGELARFTPWERFRKLELPFAAQGLIYNCMVSMAGGWFFLTINESFTLGNRSFQLPGIGSYMSVAIAQNNIPAQIAAVVAMGAMIIAVDRLVWWPLVVWSRKFKLEDTASGPMETTIVARLIGRSRFVETLAHAPGALGRALERRRPRPHHTVTPPTASPSSSWSRWLYGLVLGAIFLVGGYGCWRLVLLLGEVSLAGWMEIVGKALLTFLRVLVTLVISSLWTIPVGVWIGLNPRVARAFQPLIQFAASFPAPMLYPIVFGFILSLGGNLQWGAVVLMMLGAQWYILFNVAAGAQSIPADVNACASIFQLRGWRRWRDFILPAIFPFLVTGWITSAGGAWNASIVSEYLQQGDRTYTASGLGAYISEATNAGHFAQLAAAVVVMAICVVAINRTFWKRLQRKGDLYCRFGG
jgi:NitT/TauT family transport system permease protein